MRGEVGCHFSKYLEPFFTIEKLRRVNKYGLHMHARVVHLTFHISCDPQIGEIQLWCFCRRGTRRKVIRKVMEINFDQLNWLILISKSSTHWRLLQTLEFVFYDFDDPSSFNFCCWSVFLCWQLVLNDVLIKVLLTNCNVWNQFSQS